MVEDLRKLLGRKIREERLKRGWTIEELAEYTDISSSFLSSVERGERALSMENLIKFSYTLETPLDLLLKERISINSRIDMINELTKDLTNDEFMFVFELIKSIKNFVSNNK